MSGREEEAGDGPNGHISRVLWCRVQRTPVLKRIVSVDSRAREAEDAIPIKLMLDTCTFCFYYLPNNVKRQVNSHNARRTYRFQNVARTMEHQTLGSGGETSQRSQACVVEKKKRSFAAVSKKNACPTEMCGMASNNQLHSRASRSAHIEGRK